MPDQIPVTVPPKDDQGVAFPPTSVIATGATLEPFTQTIQAAEPPEDALPENYDPFQHLKQVYYPQHNAAVALYFNDLAIDWKPNIATARSSLRVACTITPDDNELLIAMRHRLFWDLLGYGKSGLIAFYGSQQSQLPPVTGHPKIVFYFSQDAQSVVHGQTASDAEYSVRLMHQTNTSTTLLENLTTIANEIKSLFVENGVGIIHAKGNICVSYFDAVNGFPNGSKILTNSEADATTLYEKICTCVGVTFDETKLTVHTPKKSSTVGTVTTTQNILGKNRALRAYRPVVNVHFRYAYASIPGNPTPTWLVDTTRRYKPLVKI